jgi:hypothetical protein
VASWAAGGNGSKAPLLPSGGSKGPSLPSEGGTGGGGAIGGRGSNAEARELYCRQALAKLPCFRPGATQPPHSRGMAPHSRRVAARWGVRAPSRSRRANSASSTQRTSVASSPAPVTPCPPGCQAGRRGRSPRPPPGAAPPRRPLPARRGRRVPTTGPHRARARGGPAGVCRPCRARCRRHSERVPGASSSAILYTESSHTVHSLPSADPSAGHCSRPLARCGTSRGVPPDP